MRTVSDLFEAFGGPSAVARALRVGQSTASEMKRRGSIPAEHWVVLVHAAHEIGLENVTFERLAVIHAEAKGRLPEHGVEHPDCSRASTDGVRA